MKHPELENLIAVIEALLHPVTGCPWDLEQTHHSLLKYLIEESYEYIEAVELGHSELMNEELGDVLLQVLLHSIIAKKNNLFDLESVSKTLADKMIRRHPHVFGNKENLTSEKVLENWKIIKEKEKENQKKYSIGNKYLHAPALTSSFNIGKKSTSVNFDWENYRQVMDKVEEEWQEVKDELPSDKSYNKVRVREELGDLLFSIAQLSRHLEIDPEEALRDANKKFIRRFQRVEDYVWNEGRILSDHKQHELEEIWMKVKIDEAKK